MVPPASAVTLTRALMLVLAILATGHVPLCGAAQAGRGTAGSDNICSTNATVGHAVISALNLSWPGMGAVAAAAHAGDLGGACEAIAAYYAAANTSQWLRIPPVAPGTGRAGGAADDLLRDIFYLSGVDVTAKIPRNADGGLDWLDHGPNNDPEFMNCLNRWVEVLLHRSTSMGPRGYCIVGLNC